MAAPIGIEYGSSPNKCCAIRKVEVRKVKPLTAPVISGGELKGYVSAEFAFSLDPSKPLVGGLDPEAYFMDEAFRIIYSDNEIDFQHVKRLMLTR